MIFKWKLACDMFVKDNRPLERELGGGNMRKLVRDGCGWLATAIPEC